MAEWLSIPRLVDLILLGMALEALWLMRRHRSTGQAGAPPMILHLISGALLLLAMKLALTAAPPMMVAATLGTAGLAHACDLYRMTQ
ncbi:MAG: hypothetical protein EVA63_08725 [Halieaceae bacterium]|nr:MAG: hypothetical protein EVA63_08725 [Halieaceae bacterium]